MLTPEGEWHEQIDQEEEEICDICASEPLLPKITPGELHWLWIRAADNRCYIICNPHKELMLEKQQEQVI